MDNIYALAAADIAAEAGRFLKHFSDAHRLEVETKGSEFDFVTNADRASQRLIADRLKAAFPDHRFVGEEDGLTDAEVAAMLEGGMQPVFSLTNETAYMKLALAYSLGYEREEVGLFLDREVASEKLDY